MWNECYVELFVYFKGFLKVGMFIIDIFSYNVNWGLFSFLFIEKCVSYMLEGICYKYICK